MILPEGNLINSGALFVIIISLLCLVPWAGLTSFAVVVDWMRQRNDRRNPRQGDVRVLEYAAVPTELEAEHFWLLGLGFDPLGIGVNPRSPRLTREWLYHHADLPTILVSLSLDASKKEVVEFATRFEGLSIVTMNSSNVIQIHTSSLIVNTVESGISPALQFHMGEVESAASEHGEPLPMFTADDYMAWINKFDVVYGEIDYFRKVRRRNQLAAFLAAAVSVIGVASLYRFFTDGMTDWQLVVVAVITALSTLLQINWIMSPPGEGLSVEARFKQKTAVES